MWLWAGAASAVGAVLFALLTHRLVHRAREHLAQHPRDVQQHVDRGRDRVLLVTAHPDDECMFFTPLIRTLVRAGVAVELLCLSTGDFAGLGAVRAAEARASCAVLGIGCTVLDDPRLQDGPRPWDAAVVAECVQRHMRAALLGFTLLATFDPHGITRHPNHCCVSTGVRYLAASEAFAILELQTVPIASRYIGPLALLQQAAAAPRPPAVLLATLSPSESVQYGWRAMRQHASQLVWFRWLYLLFSRYMHINTFVLRRPGI